ncbi:MAG: anti-sigma factor [Chloroflexota bacterium]|nr:anti-sigma factor [Chloroflexota bacterium]
MNDDAWSEQNTEITDAHAEQQALVASYALGAVTAADADAARRLIANDADAALLYKEFAAIAAVLPEVYADVDAVPGRPSVALKERVLASARAEKGIPSDPVASHARPERVAALPPRSITEAREHRRTRLSPGWLAAAALLIAVIGLSGWNVNLHRDVAQANRDRDIVRFAASGVHAYTMAGTQNAPSANATLIESSADGGKVVFLAKGFPGAAAGQTYRVWLQKQDGSYWDVGTFSGGNETTLVLPGNLNGVHAVVITAEPETRPAAMPTGPPVMEGALTA